MIIFPLASNHVIQCLAGAVEYVAQRKFLTSVSMLLVTGLPEASNQLRTLSQPKSPIVLRYVVTNSLSVRYIGESGVGLAGVLNPIIIGFVLVATGSVERFWKYWLQIQFTGAVLVLGAVAGSVHADAAIE